MSAPSSDYAKRITEQAEVLRRTLAEQWLGKELAPWSQPCTVRVTVGESLGAGGVTSFTFEQGEATNLRMQLQGSLETILKDTLPHEVMHAVLASHFGRPLPRWADEGVCLAVESKNSQAKLQKVRDELRKSHQLPRLLELLEIKEYPSDVSPMFAQSYAIVDLLLQKKGRRKFITFLEDALETNDWETALKKQYDVKNLIEIERELQRITLTE